MGEGYNPVIPDIDTYFAEKYDEQKFFSININNDTATVEKMIGTPLYKQILDDSSTLWYYTGDGKCKWMDFAWLGRELKIRNGRVISISTPIHYD